MGIICCPLTRYHFGGMQSDCSTCGSSHHMGIIEPYLWFTGHAQYHDPVSAYQGRLRDIRLALKGGKDREDLRGS
ncbi:hypothetical protein N7468_007037 [Penicillium chermesinum]|uniref:Uncharacterized protein n=1 Tax=Penicillium chermesinum TaxID=63820 RepID=A0A9W9TK57_9EURO|nr:uncharacterized protein N7468_007037 [Penicillium chermesinum]KAJ5225812.1 hypothetical protein N7468_007037 [Penicillium chermesinum]